MRVGRNAIPAIVAVGIFASCGGRGGPASLSPSAGSSTPSSSSNSSTSTTGGSGGGVAAGTAIFTESPLDLGVISSITPIGNLNPPDHTLPTNHAYFFHPSAANADVHAPAAGTITSLQRAFDDSIYVTVSPGFDYYLFHVRIDASLSQGARVSAGQTVGVTASAAGAMDLGVVNNAVTQFFVRPDRYIVATLHGDSPLKYFAEPIGSSLYAKVARTGGDKDGQIAFDQTGRLAGNWFSPDLSAAESENSTSGPKILVFARDVLAPDQIRIAIGGSLSTPGTFYVQPGAVDPKDVTPASGKVIYQLLVNPQAPTTRGLLMVQMLADDRIQVEAFAGATTAPADFTSAALTYVR